MKEFIDKPKDIEDLYPLVEKEAKLIKENFTTEEIDKLRGAIVIPDNPQSCIYGIMVGNCNAERVSEFIDSNLDILVKSALFVDLESKFKKEERSYFFMTPLEEYIYGDFFYSEDTEDEIEMEKTEKRIDNVLNLLLS